MANKPAATPQSASSEFMNKVRAGYPLVWIKTHEEHRVLMQYVTEITKKKILNHETNASEKYTAYSWDVSEGIRSLDITDGCLSLGEAVKDTQDTPIRALAWLDQNGEDNTILFLKDFHAYLQKKDFGDADIVRRMIRNLISKFKAQGKVLAIVSPVVDIPTELDKEVSVINFKLPDREDLKQVLQGVCESAGIPENKQPKGDELDAVLNAALGMTSVEAENAFSYSLIISKKFDASVIRQEKASIVKKSGVMEIFETTESLDTIGGLENLKTWLKKRKKCCSSKAKEFGVRPLKGVVFVGPPGTGKAQPLDATIYTPQGIKRMGDIKIGDMICHPTGITARVVAVYPQGKKDIYKVSFKDGSFTECCEDHLWEVSPRDIRWRKKNRIVMALKDMISHIISKDGHYNYSIRLTSPVKFHHKKVLIDPYVMGSLLGDGSLGNIADTKHRRALGFTSFDDLIVEKVKKFVDVFPNHQMKRKQKGQYNLITTKGAQGQKGRYNQFKSFLEKYGLLGMTSPNKFIPEEYLFNDVQSRLQLLRGLCDTDGTASKRLSEHSIEFSTSSERLARDIRFLVESLGGICPITQRMGYYKKNGIRKNCKKAYRCWIRFDTLNPFDLPRKSNRHRDYVRYHPTRVITGIEKIGIKEAQCISIDKPDGLYLTNNFIVTHNSLTAKAASSLLERPLLKLDLGNVLDQYVGNSEHNMGRCLEMADAISPCVLWIDEVEKDISGNKGGQDSHEVSKKILKMLLNWMQERKSDVFVVMTANQVESLPPELIRPGRIDAVYWVDLPDAVQRAEIIRIHLKKVHRDATMFDKNMDELVDLCKDFTGAEIETWITEALVRAFDAEHDELTLEDLKETVREITPISILMAADIARARNWAENRHCKVASINHTKPAEATKEGKRKISIPVPPPSDAAAPAGLPS
jgi:SpoVK/Ycf46/Vps4 family AAA+-type ATPase